MNEQLDGMPNPISVERIGDRELAITQIFDAVPEIVYEAWSQAELFRRWWFPRSATGISLESCELDVRSGGTYRLEFRFGPSDTMAFHGRYLEVVPNERIVWTNDEEEGGAVTTVTFAAQDTKTRLNFHEIYPSLQAREEAMEGSAAALPEQLMQLNELLAGLGSQPRT
ncbi:SRPBCC domain-containing protein [Rhizobium alvei]|uniref:SRPBCC domain-containing protein n=1 Tax=Rhizobium alvei TaxID=1132659 RepID=A0ABT8YGM5_9HYPH|nr:SRPBCC domain-containing protein [Rhizobium alvei]MDO6962817.1 SRPBCC domain-containing protein [Rhizobium alvei]